MSTANFGRQKSWLPSSSKPGSASSLISLAMPDDWLEGLPMPKSSGRAGSLKNLAKFPSVDRSRGLPSVPDFRPSAAGPVRAMPQALEFSSKKSSPVVFEDLDDTDYSSSFVHVPKVVVGLRPGHGGQGYTFGGREAFPLELNSAMDIRNLLFGSILKTFPPEWSKQGFLFSDMTGLKFGLVQHGGGPCGVLAALQAMTLRNLLFGSALYPKSDKGATFPNVDPSPSERNAALIAAMAEIFSKTSGPGKNPRIVMPAGRKNFSAVGMYKSDGITESLAVIPMKSRQDTVSFLDIMNVKSKLEKGRPATSADEKMFLLYPHEVSQRNRPSAAGPVRAMPQALEFSSKKSSPVVFEDLDDADYSSSFVHVPKVVAGLRPGHGGQGYTFGGREAFPLELNSAMDIRNLLFGSILKTFPPEWSKQGFLFSDLTGLKFGLIQHGGGPCGVLAALQAMTLRNLLFGSALYPKSDKGATFPNFDPSPSERKAALIAAMAEIFSKTSGPGKNPRIVMPAGRKNFSAVGMYKSDGITESLAVIPMKSRQDTVSFLMDHIGAWIGSENSQALILFVYSLILSRGIPVIKEDMDSPTNTLIASHGYSTQELVNLVLVGQAVSNVFDNDITLGDDVGPKGSSVMKLRGVHTRSDIGFLSLFEHYKSCQVGSNYKSPKYPVWVVCSESHYSVLFSGSKELSTTDWQWETNPKKFDLYYYDGLARQDHLIRLTVDVSSDSIRKTSPHSDLIPPLELCIRTKWPDARVEWNESEPILPPVLAVDGLLAGAHICFIRQYSQNVAAQLWRTVTLRLTANRMYLAHPAGLIDGSPELHIIIERHVIFSLYNLDGLSEDHPEIFLSLETAAFERVLSTVRGSQFSTLRSIKMQLTNKGGACLTLDLELECKKTGMVRNMIHDIPVDVIPLNEWNGVPTPAPMEFSAIFSLPSSPLVSNLFSFLKGNTHGVNIVVQHTQSKHGVKGTFRFTVNADMYSIALNMFELDVPPQSIVPLVLNYDEIARGRSTDANITNNFSATVKFKKMSSLLSVLDNSKSKQEPIAMGLSAKENSVCFAQCPCAGISVNVLLPYLCSAD
ncbi:unnamed protein product [Notodromas monacha]|uniref:Ubiquitin carboxyl-terminal hydrolase MINDY n=1 Tax=Notodromas monacha TaxID=399045 RepID=A0A7R9BYQ0_9CRUS|nr:unnamed protein product [Notodromas monacha]CAG0924241.1 unnamed protein product [Notodromas monacha]